MITKNEENNKSVVPLLILLLNIYNDFVSCKFIPYPMSS